MQEPATPSLVGSNFNKDFGAGVGLFKGKVVCWDPRSEFYRVIYTDGDKEDMTYEELIAKRARRR